MSALLPQSSEEQVTIAAISSHLAAAYLRYANSSDLFVGLLEEPPEEMKNIEQSTSANDLDSECGFAKVGSVLSQHHKSAIAQVTARTMWAQNHTHAFLRSLPLSLQQITTEWSYHNAKRTGKELKEKDEQKLHALAEEQSAKAEAEQTKLQSRISRLAASASSFASPSVFVDTTLELTPVKARVNYAKVQVAVARAAPLVKRKELPTFAPGGLIHVILMCTYTQSHCCTPAHFA
jgi:hypothetical protein